MLSHNGDKVITPIYAGRMDFWGIHHKNHTIIVNISPLKALKAAPPLALKPLPSWIAPKNTFVMSLNF